MKYFKDNENNLYVDPILENHSGLEEIDDTEFETLSQPSNEEVAAKAELEASVLSRLAKLDGVEYEGVKYSATKEDMWGLTSAYLQIQAGGSVNFEFDNGNVLLLTPANYQEFWSVWVPFRASFF